MTRGRASVGVGRALVLAALVGLVGPACRKRRQAPATTGTVKVMQDQVRPRAAGSVAGGVFTDTTYGLTVDLPPGWRLDVGVDDQPLRAALYNPDSGTRVEVRAWALDQDLPPARVGCTWSFHDPADYHTLPFPAASGAATCTPDRDDAPLVFAYLARKPGALVSVEVVAGPERLAGDKAEGDIVARRVRW